MTWTIPDQGEPANDLQAILFQSSLDALAAADAQTGVVTGCSVTAQASPDMTVAVAAGTVSLAGATAAVASGNVTIGAADGTNPRLDLVVANSSGVKSVIAGTAAAAPKEPTLDTTTYILLAQVYVPAAATTITTARITDRRVMLAFPKFFAAGYTTGRYYTGLGGRGGNQTMVNNQLYLRPFPVVNASQAFDRISAFLTTAGVGGAPVLRMGLYADNGGGKPSGAALLDAGTVIATATGQVDITISQTLSQGWYWIAVVAQGATTTQPALVAFNATGGVGGGTPAQSPGTGNIGSNVLVDSYVQSSVTGALPSIGSISDQAGAPMIWLRAA